MEGWLGKKEKQERRGIIVFQAACAERTRMGGLPKRIIMSNMKRCAFVIRVSTDKQARNPEGSLTNQLQRLKAHLEYKNVACGEHWVEASRYILKGVSGKDSFRSPEFQQLFEDIKIGRVNTVICTALDRISRSVKDFLNFFEIINKYNVEFVCLKQNYDTTSAQGKLFITIMMALAEFEREQTSERNKDATIARAERGLWNGGQILGYDLDPNKKGYLIINQKEKALIQSAFKKYLECGSLMETGRALNRQGYRTKTYLSRRGRQQPAKLFGRTNLKHILINLAYVGLKEINKKDKNANQEKLLPHRRYRTVKAVWEPLIDNETFFKVQELLKQNTASRHNQTTIIKHTYLLNHGLLWCEKCGTQMEGTCATGRKQLKYFYYRCRNQKCGFKVSASEVERVVVTRIKQLALEDDYLSSIVKETNKRLQKELPQLKTQKAMLEKELDDVKSVADGLLEKWAKIDSSQASRFLKDKLDNLDKRRKEIEQGIASLEVMIEQIERESISAELVLEALAKFSEIWDNIEPYQQKELLRLVLQKAILGPESIKMALYGRLPDPDTEPVETTASATPCGASRCETSKWLPLTYEIRKYFKDSIKP